MRRFTITLEDDLDDAFAQHMQAHGYSNRSEAVRDLLRQDIGQAQLQLHPVDPGVAVLSYLYVPHERSLAQRLLKLQETHRGLIDACLSSQANATQRLEVQMLRGRMHELRAYAWAVISLPGVLHGQVQYRVLHGALRDDGFVPAAELTPQPAPRQKSRR